MDHTSHIAAAQNLALAFGEICRAPGAGAWGVAAGLLLTGLVGGVAHCGPMCGPFVLAQLRPEPGDAVSGGGGVLWRLSGGLLLPYHLGRATTYVLLGALAGGLGRAVLALTQFRWVLAAFLMLAALLFAAQAIPALKARLLPGSSSLLGGGAGRLLGRVAGPLLRRPGGGGPRGYALGVALGFLPCGFLYAALAAAAGTGGAPAGALAMAGFVLGTVPILVAVGASGAAAAQRWRRAASVVATPLLLLNAALLVAAAIRTAAAAATAV